MIPKKSDKLNDKSIIQKNFYNSIFGFNRNKSINKSLIQKNSNKKKEQMSKYGHSEENIDLKKRDFIKKSVLGLAGLGGVSLLSQMPFVKSWKIFSETEFKDYSESTVSANTSTSYTIDLTNANVYDLTLTGNCTFIFSGSPTSGKAGSFTLILTQDGTGSRTATWPASVDWAGGTAPTLTTTATTGVDVLTFVTTDGGTTWWGFLSGGDMK